MKKNLLSEKIRNIADSTGIDVLGFAEASEFSDYAIRNSERRNPKLSLPNAKTIIVAGIYIGPVTLPAWKNPWYGRTSRLYLSEFFLDVVKPLEPIVDFLKNAGYQAIVCEGSKKDGSILPLKLAAIRAGLGWQGKHSLLISKKYGTFLALGGILTNADLEHAAQEESNRCHKCDKCQKACPWNKKHLDNPLVTNMTESFQKKIEDWKNFFYLPDLVELSEKGYREKLGQLNTGIPYNLFQRNVLIAIERAKKSERSPTFKD